MGDESSDFLRRLTRELMRDLASRSLGDCWEGPHRDTFTLRPNLAKSGLLVTRPGQTNFIRSEKGSLLFRDAVPALIQEADAKYPGRRMLTSPKRLEFRWTQLTSKLIRHLFATVEALGQSAAAAPTVSPEPTTETFEELHPHTTRSRSGKALRYTFHPNGVDQAMPLIYTWEIRDPSGRLRHCYVGESTQGASRPLTRYMRNVANLLAGRPYSRAKPNGFRVVHRRLADATRWQWPITLVLIRNVEPDEDIFDVEARYIKERAFDDWPDGEPVTQEAIPTRYDPVDTRQFLAFLRLALDEVEEVYYGLHNSAESMLNGNNIDAGDPRRQALLSYFSRRDERVFCYELYHRLRTHMDTWGAQDPAHRRASVRLQGELRKEVIGQLAAEILGATPLSQVYLPDLILHAPGNFDAQELVIEIKTAANLSWSSIKKDLTKLEEFLAKYHFGKALFLITNNAPDRIAGILRKQEIGDWIVGHLPRRRQILVWCKETRGATLWECNLGSLLDGADD